MDSQVEDLVPKVEDLDAKVQDLNPQLQPGNAKILHFVNKSEVFGKKQLERQRQWALDGREGAYLGCASLSFDWIRQCHNRKTQKKVKICPCLPKDLAGELAGHVYVLAV